MPTQAEIEYVRKLWEGLIKEYDNTGNEQIPAVATYLCAAWCGMKMMAARQDGPKGGKKANAR